MFDFVGVGLVLGMVLWVLVIGVFGGVGMFIV